MLRHKRAVGRIKFLITCEHASARIPKRYGFLGLPRRTLQSHFGWDIGAAGLARRLARSLRCDYLEARYSRLLIDVNRSESHPRLIPRSVGGRCIPANTGLRAKERQARVLRYWKPHRHAVDKLVLNTATSGRTCVHLAIHSFTPVLDGRARACDVGLLFDPRHCQERAIAEHLRGFLRASGARVRFNYPYKGTSDGLAAAIRARVSPARYAGLEIELNQAVLRQKSRERRIGKALLSGLRCLLDPAGAVSRTVRAKKCR